jgi:tellurite resistance protein
MAKKGAGRRSTSRSRAVDEALIALFIGAMQANGHVAREELGRAHHLIWSTRRFRRRSGERVGALIERTKRRLAEQDAAEVVEQAARTVPARLRASAFALVTDLLLADGTMDVHERAFLRDLAATFGLARGASARIVEALLVKNQL